MGARKSHRLSELRFLVLASVDMPVLTRMEQMSTSLKKCVKPGGAGKYSKCQTILCAVQRQLDKGYTEEVRSTLFWTEKVTYTFFW
ncbi:hypothetical protein K402DRAFT_392570 [Aulographum hederae CBS 113979]|uniref:Uncharacterized protein n=1 Tax=Aulographum hederae CBS 113979 TaxID=1176131 RepID=A0A6G1H476_9PEZI|nr:hypothetical protein K402DRAFT_392570 [Aulographum hederae CBS 113979]